MANGLRSIIKHIGRDTILRGRLQMDEQQARIKYEIVQNVGILSESGTWKKELNIVQWGDYIAKYDIRAWNSDHTKLGKGVTLSTEELRALKAILNGMDL